MRGNRKRIWLERIALLLLLTPATGSPVSAQTAPPNLESTLTPGMTVWITERSGREEKARIVEIAGDSVTTAAGEDVRRRRVDDIVRIRARQSDSVLNGALIGAGAAVASGLAMCRLMESWEICRSNVGPTLRIGALGAGIGIAVDALIRGRKTIYEPARGSTRLHAAPVVGHRAAGMQVSISF